MIVPPAGLEQRRSLRRKVLHLAGPLMVANLSQTFLSITDTAMVGRLGATSLAAMGPATVFFLVLFLVTSSTFMGIQALVARRFGEERFEACGRILDHGLALAIALGAVTGLLGLVLSDAVAEVLVKAPHIAPLTGDYLRVRWGAILVLTVLWAFKGFYFGVGITWLDMVVAAVMNALNVLLNWMFLYGNLGAPEMGLSGAALASVIATGFAATTYLLMSLRPSIRRRFALFRLKELDLGVLRSIVKLSLPRAMAGFAFGGSIIYFKLIGDHCGETALAASTVIWRFFGVSVLASIAVGSAAASVVGHELGARRFEGAETAASEAVRLAVAVNAIIGLLVVAAPDLVMRIFTTDEAVIEAGRAPLRLVAVFMAVDAAGIVLSRVLSAAGCAVYVMTMEFVVNLGCMLSAAIVLTMLFPENLTLVWCTWIVYILCWYLAMVLKFRTGGWKAVRI